MNYNNPVPKRVGTAIIVMCRLLFMAFTFLYLRFMMGDLLAQAQFIFSNGITSYHKTLGALIITVVLVLMQWLVAKAIKLPTRYHAITYFPSFLTLAVLADFNQSSFEKFSFGGWIWIYPTLWVLFVLVALWLKRIPEDNVNKGDKSTGRFLWPNYLTLLVMMLATGSIPSTPDVYHYELKVESLIHEGKYEDALRVGEESLVTSRRLTELRLYALARTGKMGDKLFDYPMYSKEGAVISIGDTAMIRRVDYQEICAFIADSCADSIHSKEQFFSIMDQNDTTLNMVLGNYRLANFLLKKDMEGFMLTSPKYYNLSDTSLLPKAYREAFVLAQVMSKKGEIDDILVQDSCYDDATWKRYHDYDSLKHQLKDPVERRNRLRREYGHTAWWFFDYQ